MSRFVRPSKYRHVYASTPKRENCYENVKVSGSAWDTDLVKASAKYLAINYASTGGGAFAVLPLLSAYAPPKTEAGRPFGTKLPDIMPLCRGHSAPVLDTAFSPFSDTFLASASEDGKVLLWEIPAATFDGWGEDGWGVDTSIRGGQGEIEDLRSCGTLMAGGGRKVGQVVFHPTAEGLLASASGDHVVRLWDVQHEEAAKITLKGHNDTIQSMAWNTTGTALVTTARDRKLRLFDPRAGSDAVRTTDGHGGIKGSRVVWAGDRDRIITTGFSKMSDRQMALWETGSLSNLKMEVIDSSSGVLMPFFADGNDVLFLAGKGDGNVRYYEYADDELHYLSEYKSSDPQRGMGFLPRRALDVGQNEIARAFKVAGSAIEPLSFVVPRKAESFQSDIFPPAPSIEAPLTAADFFGGKTAKPKLVDLESGSVSEDKTLVAAMATSVHRETPQKSQTAPPTLASPQEPATPAAAARAPEPEPAPAALPAHEPVTTAKDLEIEQADEDDEEESEEPAVRSGLRAAEAAVISGNDSGDAKELVKMREEMAVLKEQLSAAEAANAKLLAQLNKAKQLGRELTSL